MRKLRSYTIESLQDERFDGPAICHNKPVTISYLEGSRLPQIQYRGMERAEPIEIYPISSLGYVYISAMRPGDFSFDIAISKNKLVTILNIIGARDYAKVVKMI